MEFPDQSGPAGVAMTYMFDGKQYIAVAIVLDPCYVARCRGSVDSKLVP